MALYPAQLTPEEKALKKKYAKLLEKRKQLRKATEKSPQSAPKPNKDVLNPKDAKEVAKKLLSSGKLTIAKKSPLKKSGFKRVGQQPGQSPPRKKPNLAPEKAPPPKPKVKAAEQKALYSRFVKATNPSEDLERIPKRQPTPADSAPSESAENKFSSKECTIFVRCHHPVGEKALRIAFKRFGAIQTLTPGDQANNSAFITFNKPTIASTAKKEMDRGMIHGSDVGVEPASSENGYVELSAEAASNPWSQIAAGRELAESPVKKGDLYKQRQNRIVSYSDPDF